MSTTLHIRPYGPNPWGYPEDFPAEVREGQTGAPPAGWFALPRAEYEAYVTARKAQADAAAAAQKAASPAPPPPPPQQQLIPKDTVVRRIRAAGKLTEMRQLIASMSANDQFEFAHLTQLDPTDTRLRNGITSLGLDPDVILAP